MVGGASHIANDGIDQEEDEEMENGRERHLDVPTDSRGALKGTAMEFRWGESSMPMSLREYDRLK